MPVAAAATTARGTPGGIPLRDGFSTKIALAADANIEFWEKDVQPPGLDIGNKIDTTTMFNTRYKTGAAPSLIETTDVQATVAYDPLAYTAVIAILGVETDITVHFPDGSTISMYGYLASFKPDTHASAKQPEAKVVFHITNWDPDANGEQGPVETNVAGT